jgi:hemin uptake protein HemP
MDIQPLSLRSNIVGRTTPADQATVPEIASAELMRGGREILIRHGKSTYRLRTTMSDKLILTK